MAVVRQRFRDGLSDQAVDGQTQAADRFLMLLVGNLKPLRQRTHRVFDQVRRLVRTPVGILEAAGQ